MLPDGPPRSTETTLRWLTRPHELLRECANRYGDRFTLDLGASGSFVVVTTPAAIHDVFTAPASALHAGEGNDVMGAFLGPRSLLLLEEAPHARERRFLAPAFHGRRIAAWAESIHEAANREIDSWIVGQDVVAQDAMQRISIDVILEAIFGVSGRTRRAALREALLSFLADPKFNLGLMGTLDTSSKSPAWTRFTAALHRIRAMLRDLVRSRRERVSDQASDVLAMMLSCSREDGTRLTDQELEDELLTLSVTGFETTATALSWGLFAIHATPRVRDALSPRRTLPPFEPPPRDGYVDAVCREVLRLHPVIPIVARRAREPVTVDGLEIPEGCVVAPCIYLAHRREEVWPEPDAFRPERFLSHHPSPWEYLPFGGGTRRCLGMQLALAEMRIVLSTILSRATLEPLDPDAVRPRRRSVTIAPASGPRFRVIATTERGGARARTG